ncbi:MAG: ferrochelatase, partial [Acidimicrobiales bacterium]
MSMSGHRTDPGSGTARTGVLVMAHGTPAARDEIEPFYTSIRQGRPPAPALLAELVSRYDAIGGVSPLAERTRAQVEGLAAALETLAPGEYAVRFGAKHTSPSIEEGMTALRAQHVSRVIGVVLTPHQSSLGSDQYLSRAHKAAQRVLGAPGAPPSMPPLPFIGIRSWHRAPGFADLLADRTGAAL